MKNYKTVTKTTLELATLTCDVCKVEYEESFDIQEFLCYSDVGGYGSKIGDMTKKEIDICEKCVIDLLGQYLRTRNLN